MHHLSPISGMLVLILVSPICVARCHAQAPQGGVAADRIAAIAQALGEKPYAFGPRIDDRQAWENLRQSLPDADALIAKATKLASQPIPDLPDELFLEFSRNGNRDNYQSVYFGRVNRLAPLALAECFENKGRFIPAIQQTVAALCSQRTWVLPAHDSNLQNFNGKNITIDLFSSALAYELSQVSYQLGDRLDAPTRKLIDENIRRRVLDPFRQTLTGNRPAEWWFTTTNNWNAVCLDGVVGAALATLDSRQDRALFAAAAEKYTQNFLAGFGSDGYCSEGLGYWNYGFGNYIALSELLYRATDGKLNLFARPIVRQAAIFPRRLEIINGVYPAYADCAVNAKPDRALTWLLDRRLALGIDDWTREGPPRPQTSFRFTLMYATAPATAAVSSQASASPDPLRAWFEQAHILTARPRPGSDCRLAVSLKGGNNNEHHNHNDVGSYVVVVGHTPLLLDPGSEVYTARTFSKDRYQSKVLNSFGHAVPLVAGQLQKTGADAHAVVTEKQFTDASDKLVFDIRSCYDVPSLQKLNRTFVYGRDGAGSLSVTDEAEFSSPESFGTALITLSKWKQLSPTTLLIYDGTNPKDAVQVQIDTGGAPFEIKPEEIHEHVHTPTLPLRIGINLKDPTAHTKITTTITPAS